jgi:hypothetical protein
MRTTPIRGALGVIRVCISRVRYESLGRGLRGGRHGGTSRRLLYVASASNHRIVGRRNDDPHRVGFIENV